MKSSTARILLGILLAAAFFIRAGWGLMQSSDEAAIDRLPDQREYLEAGRNLLHHEGLWFSDPRFSQPVYAYRTPGYPALIALCDGNISAIRLVQSLLDVSTILATYLLARRWMGFGLSVLAALFVAFNPYLIFFCGLILSETLFTAMLAWGMVLLIYSNGPWPADRARFWTWIAGGIVLGLAVLVRPGAVALPFILGAGAALANREIAVPRARIWPLPVMALFMLLTLIVLFPWAARNRLQLGAWIWTSTNAGITSYDGFNPDATGESDQRFVQSMPWLSQMTEVGRTQYFSRLADEWIEDHPGEAMRLGFIKIARTWSPIPLSGDYGTRLLYKIPGLIFGGVFYLLVITGLWRGKLPRPVKRYCLLPALYFTAAAVLSVGSLRYLVPAQAPMGILAACALGLVSGRAFASDKNGVFAGKSGSTV